MAVFSLIILTFARHGMVGEDKRVYLSLTRSFSRDLGLRSLADRSHEESRISSCLLSSTCTKLESSEKLEASKKGHVLCKIR